MESIFVFVSFCFAFLCTNDSGSPSFPPGDAHIAQSALLSGQGLAWDLPAASRWAGAPPATPPVPGPPRLCIPVSQSSVLLLLHLLLPNPSVVSEKIIAKEVIWEDFAWSESIFILPDIR